MLQVLWFVYFVSKAMTIIPVGFTYATYGALTITAVTLFGIFKYNQTPNILWDYWINLNYSRSYTFKPFWKSKIKP